MSSSSRQKLVKQKDGRFQNQRPKSKEKLPKPRTPKELPQRERDPNKHNYLKPKQEDPLEIALEKYNLKPKSQNTTTNGQNDQKSIYKFKQNTGKSPQQRDRRIAAAAAAAAGGGGGSKNGHRRSKSTSSSSGYHSDGNATSSSALPPPGRTLSSNQSPKSADKTKRRNQLPSTTTTTNTKNGPASTHRQRRPKSSASPEQRRGNQAGRGGTRGFKNNENDTRDSEKDDELAAKQQREELAAVKIQSSYRGYRTRKQMKGRRDRSPPESRTPSGKSTSLTHRRSRVDGAQSAMSRRSSLPRGDYDPRGYTTDGGGGYSTAPGERTRATTRASSVASTTRSRSRRRPLSSSSNAAVVYNQKINNSNNLRRRNPLPPPGKKNNNAGQGSRKTAPQKKDLPQPVSSSRSPSPTGPQKGKMLRKRGVKKGISSGRGGGSDSDDERSSTKVVEDWFAEHNITDLQRRSFPAKFDAHSLAQLKHIYEDKVQLFNKMLDEMGITDVNDVLRLTYALEKFKQ